MDVKVKPEVAVITVGAIKIALIVWLFILWRSAESEKNDAIEVSEQIIKERISVLDKQDIKLRSDSLSHVENMDSAHRVYEALERVKKSDFYYYQKQLKNLEKINTYTARQRFADSLARTVR